MNTTEDCLVIKSADIHTKGRPPEDILSNFCVNDFCFDDVHCGCMESFLRSLSWKDAKLQRSICFSKADWSDRYISSEWQVDQTLWWKGEPIGRHSPEYAALIRGAYMAMFLWCARFRDALMGSVGKRLVYDTGCNDATKAILTDREFCEMLTEIREANKDEYGKVIYPRMWPNSYGVDEDYDYF